MELYQKTKEHEKNNEAFRMLVRRYEWMRFYQPNEIAAPWHWQCLVRGEGPYVVAINFWPHVAKAQREYCKSVQGWDEIRSLISTVIDENGFDEIEVIE